jgi:2,4-dienoyl-CoA reductase-like NADH-dependent reductase (Old Yellow Enzyme family)
MEKSLFDAVNIGPVTLKNRFVRSATWEGMCDQDGAVTPRLVEYYRDLARGGVGLIITGYTYVREDGKQLQGKMGLYSDTLIPGLQGLTDAVRQQGCLVFCQLVHAGGQTSAKITGTQPLAPSAVDFPSYGATPREMFVEEIEAIVEAFGAAASRAKQAGFDGVQLHGAHGYLINQFLSPLSNRRTDRYGGSLGNRMRFPAEVYAAVRETCGDDFPVTIKLTAHDHLPGGFQVDEAVEVAQRLAELGIDAIEVSSGTPASGKLSPVRQGIDSPEKEAYNAEFARLIRQAVDIPVISVGGLRSCDVMQRMLWEGDAGLFALSRPLIREPDLPRKWQADDCHVASCISCNGCFKPGYKEGGIYCIIDKIELENRDS